MGGRGASIGGKGRGGMLMPSRGAKSERIDTSNWGFQVKVKSDFEKYFGNEKVEHAFILDKDGNIKGGFKGSKHSVGIDPSLVKEGDIVTHNHPSSYGGTFSTADVSSLTTQKLREIRAVAKEGTYSLKATKTAQPEAFNRALANDIKSIREQATKNASKVKRESYIKKSDYDKASRKAYVDTLSSWYKKNASKYGYKYTAPKNS